MSVRGQQVPDPSFPPAGHAKLAHTDPVNFAVPLVRSIVTTGAVLARSPGWPLLQVFSELASSDPECGVSFPVASLSDPYSL